MSSEVWVLPLCYSTHFNDNLLISSAVLDYFKHPSSYVANSMVHAKLVEEEMRKIKKILLLKGLKSRFSWTLQLVLYIYLGQTIYLATHKWNRYSISPLGTRATGKARLDLENWCNPLQCITSWSNKQHIFIPNILIWFVTHTKRN